MSEGKPKYSKVKATKLNIASHSGVNKELNIQWRKNIAEIPKQSKD